MFLEEVIKGSTTVCTAALDATPRPSLLEFPALLDAVLSVAFCFVLLDAGCQGSDHIYCFSKRVELLCNSSNPWNWCSIWNCEWSPSDDIAANLVLLVQNEAIPRMPQRCQLPKCRVETRKYINIIITIIEEKAGRLQQRRPGILIFLALHCWHRQGASLHTLIKVNRTRGCWCWHVLKVCSYFPLVHSLWGTEASMPRVRSWSGDPGNEPSWHNSSTHPQRKHAGVSGL